jgi:hypothetical protein
VLKLSIFSFANYYRFQFFCLGYTTTLSFCPSTILGEGKFYSFRTSTREDFEVPIKNIKNPAIPTEGSIALEHRNRRWEKIPDVSLAMTAVDDVADPNHYNDAR